MKKRIVVGLVGQPNVGKSSLFNVITKGNAIVTNWPGTTAERHEGRVAHRGYELVFVDLPGIYGLSYLTMEEGISRNFIAGGEYDLLVVLVDSLALDRTLYLAVEIRELTGRVVVAVTKIDETHSRGIHINYELLEKRLGVPVVPVSALKNIGLEELFDTIIEHARREAPLLKVDYGELEPFISSIEQVLQPYQVLLKYPTRWLAVKYLEDDHDVEELLRNTLKDRYFELEEVKNEAKRRIGKDLAAFASTRRMSFIQEHLIRDAVIKISVPKREKRPLLVFYNPYVAPAISIAIFFGLFLLVFTISTGYPLSVLLSSLGYSEFAQVLEEYSISSLMERLLEYLGGVISSALGEGLLSSLVVDGILGGVAAILLFIPLVAIVMAVLGMLEDSGLLPRLAVGTHVLLQRIGLSGHSLLPISLSLGCNVPGLISTRAVPSHSERLRLLLLAPFVPCQARLVVLLAIAAAIGGFAGAILVPLAYLSAFAVFILLNYAIYALTAKKQRVELLLEIPPLHKPYVRVVWWFTWFYLKHFLIKAGTVIFLVSLVMWSLGHFTLSGAYTEDVSKSVLASAAKYLAPLLTPLGISGENAWLAAYAVIVGFLAKELVISAIVTATSALSPKEAIEVLGLTTQSAVSLALFVTLYVPCLATLATIYSETRSVKYTLASLVVMLVTAYIYAAIAYAIGTLLA